MFSSKTAVASAGVLTAAVALGLAAPTFSSFLFAEVPRVYGALSGLLKPPYLYFLINGIIISIVAATHFHNNPVVIQAPLPATSRPELVAQAESLDGHINPVSSITVMEYGDKSGLNQLQSILASPSAMYGQPEDDVISQSIWLSNQNESKEQQLVDELRSNLATTGMYDQSEDAVEDLISRSIWPPEQLEIKEQKKKKPMFSEYEAKSEFDVMRSIIPIPAVITTSVEATTEAEDVLSQLIWPSQSTKSNKTLALEKPLMHSRIGHHQRRSTKTLIPEGKAALGVARSKREETLEGTWKAITDGRAVPLARHLKKSDTWTDQHRKTEEDQVRLTRKADTFNERTARRRPPVAKNAAASGGNRLHKEPSLGQDELNKRVEAFINKFNEDMRLQRQDSVQQYVDMINRGSH